MATGTNSDDIAIPLPSQSQIVASKRPSSTSPESHLPSKKSRTGSYTLDASSSDFAGLVESGAFVDKSHALKDFLEDRTPVHLLLRPRRSGKTTLLRMFRDFFQLTGPDEKTERKGLFKNLAIAGDVRFETEFAMYPVMYLDFAGMSGATMADLRKAFKLHITLMVQDLEDSGHFQNRDTLPDNLRRVLETVLRGQLSDDDLPTILFRLTKILKKLHGRVIVLIDEHDTPMTNVANSSFALDAQTFFRQVYQKVLKDNENLRGALVVGILHIAKASLLSGINNVKVFALGETHRYSEACMFTGDEISSLYDRQSKIKKLPFTFDDLEKWYNGYSTLDDIKLFNPWSVSYALTEGKLDDWWTDSGYDATIQDGIGALLRTDEEFRSKCQELLDGKTIKIVIDHLVYSSFPKLSKEELWTFIYYAGYLARCSNSVLGRMSVRIPNFEIKSQFRKWIRTDFERSMANANLDYGPSVSLFSDMVNGKFSEFSKAFGEFVLTSMPQRIFGSQDWVYQDWVHAYFSGVAGAMGNQKWTIRMEEVAGDGRADIILHDDEKGAILELKHLPHPKKEGYHDYEKSLLSKATNEALNQCDTRHYRASMPEGVITIVEYGIAFLGPYCAVEARMLERQNGGWITRNEYSVSTDDKRRRDTYVKQ